MCKKITLRALAWCLSPNLRTSDPAMLRDVFSDSSVGRIARQTLRTSSKHVTTGEGQSKFSAVGHGTSSGAEGLALNKM